MTKIAPTISLAPEIWTDPASGQKIYFYSIQQLEEMQRLKRIRDANDKENHHGVDWGYKPNLGLRYER